MTEDTEPTIKIFNPALAKMERIHHLKVMISQLRTQGRFPELLDCLISWRNELECNLSEEDRGKCDTLERIAKNNNYIITQAPYRFNMEYPTAALTNYERFLWRLEKKLGLSGESANRIID